jgi:tryptophan oxidase VioA
MMNDQFSPDAAAGDIPCDLAAYSGSEVRLAHSGRRTVRGQEQVRAIPVTIVGGGIGGLSVALSLLDAGAVSATDITIVDANPGSGRLDTYTGSLGHVCELGAGRYSPRLHPRLDALVTRFGIDVAPHVFTIKYQSGQAEADEFSAMDLTGLNEQASFYDALAERLGTAKADRFCSLTGYEAIRDRRFPVAGGLDLISTHPEAFRSAAHRSGWVAPATGFTGLVGALRDYLAGQGVTMLHSTSLVAAESGPQGLDLELFTSDRRRLHLATEQVVLAIPPTELLSLRLPVHPRTFGWLPHLVTVPLSKGFLTFGEPWWKDSELDCCCIVTDNELQKLYFDTARRAIYFYCDSSNSNYWATLRASGDSVFRDTLRAKIEQAVGRELPDLDHAEEFVSRDWPVGITYLERGTPFDGPGYVRIGERILLSTGAFTGNPGWIEGVLANASLLASELGETSRGRVTGRHVVTRYAKTTTCRHTGQRISGRRHKPRPSTQAPGRGQSYCSASSSPAG